MKKIGRLTFLAFLTILAFTLAGATIIKEYYYPQVATVQTLTLETYVDTTLWTNGTQISWGDVKAGQTYTKNLTVKNTGDLTCNVTFRTENLPTGLTETWTANGAILTKGAEVTGNLTLTVASDATTGTHNWDSWVQAIGV